MPDAPPTSPWPRRIDGPMAIIGDVHGQARLLALLIKKILAQPNAKDRWIVFVGDLVDRGPGSGATLELIHNLRQRHGKVAAVMGNHDLALCHALRIVPTNPLHDWAKRYHARYACEKTFSSYQAKDLTELSEKMPQHHKDMLSTLPWVVEHPSAVVVHAGLLPDQPAGEQLAALHARATHLVSTPPWLCNRSLAGKQPPADEKRVVVSGHVPQKQVVVKDRRVLVDTGAGFGLPLSCVLWPDARVLQATHAELPAAAAESEAKRKAAQK